MYPILFQSGLISIHAYGLLVAIGFLAGVLAALHYARVEKIKTEYILDLAVYIIVSAIVGARVLYVIAEREYFKNNLIEIVMLQKGGLVFLGGLILAIATAIAYSRFRKIPILKLLDLLTPAVAIGYVFGRIGCFLNGCCFGLPAEVFWSVRFPPGSLAYSYFGSLPLHPAQLYASITMLLIFLLLVFIYRFKKFEGLVFLSGLILYSIYRFTLEFFRYYPFHFLGLTLSQWLVLAIGILALLGLVYKIRIISRLGRDT